MDSKKGSSAANQAGGEVVVYLASKLICRAIKERLVLEFDYDGFHRVVQPYCHGRTSFGRESLRAIQVAGWSRTPSIESGKLWTVAKMTNVKISGEPFLPDDRHYNAQDSALTTIHCRI